MLMDSSWSWIVSIIDLSYSSVVYNLNLSSTSVVNTLSLSCSLVSIYLTCPSVESIFLSWVGIIVDILWEIVRSIWEIWVEDEITTTNEPNTEGLTEPESDEPVVTGGDGTGGDESGGETDVDSGYGSDD